MLVLWVKSVNVGMLAERERDYFGLLPFTPLGSPRAAIKSPVLSICRTLGSGSQPSLFGAVVMLICG